MPAFDGTGPAGMGPMTGGGRGWCNPYSSPYAGYGPYHAPMAGWPARGYGFRPYGGYPRAYGLGRPRWGLRRFLGRGMGWGGRGRGRGRGRW